jgi:heme-degrading monooxygenase HmoA
MLTRFFNVRIKPGNSTEFRRFYTDEILPALQKAPGCLYASLIQSTEDPNDYISFSVWDTEGNIRAWEQSSAFALLLQKAQDYFASSAEWRVQLTKDLKLEYAPVPEEPVVKSYRESTPTVPQELSRALGGPMYVRLTSLKVEPQKVAELKQIYQSEIIPTLQKVEGCRYAFLVESPDAGEAISVTIWDSREHAEAYEQSGLFDSLVEKVRHTFSQVFQWKMKLAEEVRTSTITSEELEVKPYQVVVGKQLK